MLVRRQRHGEDFAELTIVLPLMSYCLILQYCVYNAIVCDDWLDYVVLNKNV